MPENVKRTNLEKSVKTELIRYEFKNHVDCIRVDDLSVGRCLDGHGEELPEDCLEDCTSGQFEGNGTVREPDNEGNGCIESPANFSGTFEVTNYNHESRQFTTRIYANYCKR